MCLSYPTHAGVHDTNGASATVVVRFAMPASLFAWSVAHMWVTDWRTLELLTITGYRSSQQDGPCRSVQAPHAARCATRRR